MSCLLFHDWEGAGIHIDPMDSGHTVQACLRCHRVRVAYRGEWYSSTAAIDSMVRNEMQRRRLAERIAEEAKVNT